MGKHNHHSSKKSNKDKGNEHEQHFTSQEAYKVGRCLGIDFGSCGYDVEQFRIGMDVELEHGRISPSTNVTSDDPMLTGKIALAHLNEYADYYVRLTKMEKEAEKYWSKRAKSMQEEEE